MSSLPDDRRPDEPDEPSEPTREEAELLRAEDLQIAPLIAKLREWDMPYEIDRQFPIDKIERPRNVQVREATNIAPAARVEEYSHQMRNGAVFPPVLIRAGTFALIDGHTRLKAARRVGRRTFPAIIVTTPTNDMAKVLAAAINMQGGERLQPTEAHEAALLMMEQGFPDAAVARELGRDLSQVRRWRAQDDVTKRAQRLGLDEQAKQIPRTALGPLAGVNFDAPFTELTRLLADVRPPEREARELVAKVMAEPSEAAAIAKVAELRTELAPSGPPPRVAARKQIRSARMAIANLLKLKGRPDTAFDPAKREEELARWQQAREVVEEVLAALRQQP